MVPASLNDLTARERAQVDEFVRNSRRLPNIFIHEGGKVRFDPVDPIIHVYMCRREDNLGEFFLKAIGAGLIGSIISYSPVFAGLAAGVTIKKGMSAANKAAVIGLSIIFALAAIAFPVNAPMTAIGFMVSFMYLTEGQDYLINQTVRDLFG